MHHEAACETATGPCLPQARDGRVGGVKQNAEEAKYPPGAFDGWGVKAVRTPHYKLVK
jgi:hypothetical protein